MSEGTDILRYADVAMYRSQPMLTEEGAGIRPRVFLISGTPDPLGALAVDMRMYRGDPVYNMNDITNKQREWAWEELSKTHLNTPLEGVTLKFMIEAVTRSFTHQMVRQRVGAYYVQESLRFAVKEGLAEECPLPPSIPANNEPAFKIWSDTIQAVEAAYTKLVNLGVPAEDARGLLPHCVTTRILYNTNLRALFEHAGNRLCTQAQFEWRAVFMGMIHAISTYKYDPGNEWQWKLIATPRDYTFTPICYRLGKCAFMSQLDRGCTIRERVNAGRFDQINPEEWMANPWAGITTKDNRPE
jgi:flavin-dependent thymidylate synthase